MKPIQSLYEKKKMVTSADGERNITIYECKSCGQSWAHCDDPAYLYHHAVKHLLHGDNVQQYFQEESCFDGELTTRLDRGYPQTIVAEEGRVERLPLLDVYCKDDSYFIRCAECHFLFTPPTSGEDIEAHLEKHRQSKCLHPHKRYRWSEQEGFYFCPDCGERWKY